MDKTRLAVANKIYGLHQSVQKYVSPNNRSLIKMMGLNMPDNKDDSMKYLYDNIFNSDGQVSRPMLTLIHSWTSILSAAQRPYLPSEPAHADSIEQYDKLYEEYEKRYEEAHNNFLSLPSIPKKVRKAYVLEKEINNFLDNLVEYDRNNHEARAKLKASIA